MQLLFSRIGSLSDKGLTIITWTPLKYVCFFHVQKNNHLMLKPIVHCVSSLERTLKHIQTLTRTESGEVPRSLCDSLVSPLPCIGEMQGLWGLWSRLEEQQVPQQVWLWPPSATASENQEGEREPGSSQALGSPNTRNHKPG